MTQNQREALEILNERFDQTAAIARQLALHDQMGGDQADALAGLAATLGELCERLDAIVSATGEASS